MIHAPTDDELRTFAAAAKDQYYAFNSFDMRIWNRCIFGHIHWARGGQSWELNKHGVPDVVLKNLWDTQNSRLIRLIGVEKTPTVKAYRNDENARSKDFEKREDVAIRFRLSDAVNAVERYFDPAIEETAIWPWAARGYRNIHLWAAR